MFVAGFIGSPAMSFAKVRAEPRDGSVTLARGDLSLTLRAPTEITALSGEVILGVRPEHTRLWTEGDGLLGPIDGEVSYLEMLGRESLIGVTAGDELRFTIQAGPDTAAKVGEQIRFGLEPGHLHLFDAETERALGIAGGPARSAPGPG
jgi:ABC-type sugar transport system ATPase subunit